MKMSCPYSMTVSTNNGVREPANPSYNLKKNPEEHRGTMLLLWRQTTIASHILRMQIMPNSKKLVALPLASKR